MSSSSGPQASKSPPPPNEESDLEDDDQLDEDDDIMDYYNDDDYFNTADGDVMDGEMDRKQKDDPEHFDFDLMKVEEVEQLLNERVEVLCKAINVSKLLSQDSIHSIHWLKILIFNTL